MKKLLLLLIIIGALQSNAQTNVYHPFPKDTAVWFSRYWIPLCGGACPYYRNVQMGDTVINAVGYKKMYGQSGVIISSANTLCFSPTSNLNYSGAIRQDTVAKKVYLRLSQSTHDTLFYDFNLQVGSVIPASYITNGGLTVKKIDSIPINGNYRKIFFIYDTVYNGSYLIEGIGCSYGLYQPLGVNFEEYWYLDCFNSNPIPGDNSICPWKIVAGISTYEEKELLIKTYPNPAQTNFTIETNTNGNKTMIFVFDVNGKLVLNQFIQDKTTVDVSSLHAGVYSLNITNSEGAQTKKLVIVK